MARHVVFRADRNEKLCKANEGSNVMSATIINLIIQLVAGAVGGNAVGAGLKDLNLGPLGNTIAGALGGAGGIFVHTDVTSAESVVEAAARARATAG